MKKNLVLSLIFICGSIALCLPTSSFAQPNGPDECLPVLAKDYYKYAKSSNLKEDFVKTIDESTWELLKRENEGETSLFDGLFEFSDSFSQFSEKRRRYLESVRYYRTLQEALEIIQITTSDRAYQAYEKCLISVKSGVFAWPRRQSLDQIVLVVRYNSNDPSAKSKKFEGQVTGGGVSGEPSGRLWKGKKTWKPNQEFPFTIQAAPGVSETNVTILPSDGAPAIFLTFKRADALLELLNVGTTEVLRQANRFTSAHTPNNHNNSSSNCPNFVGLNGGKWCTSRTALSLSVNEPFFLRNTRPACGGGGGCPWSSAGPISMSSDDRTASTYRDNWGLDVDAFLYADVYERMSAKQCGVAGRIPIVKHQTVLFNSLKDCLLIATMKWTLLPDKSEGTFAFGSGSSNNLFVVDSSIDTPTEWVIGYKFSDQALAGKSVVKKP